jgi:sporulation protein YlmC with PRC-barrel domain
MAPNPLVIGPKGALPPSNSAHIEFEMVINIGKDVIIDLTKLPVNEYK